MSEKVHTREFCISDYDAALLLWQRVEGLEIAEGDDRQGVAQFLARNPALSRVAIDGSAIVGVALCLNVLLSWSPTITSAARNSGSTLAGRKFLGLSRWELIFRNSAIGELTISAVITTTCEGRRQTFSNDLA